MNRFSTTPLRTAFFAGLALIVFSLPALADHHEAAAPEGMPPMGRPAEMDKVAHMLGEWEVTMQYRMAPDAPWSETIGTAVSTAVLDGCAQRMDFSTDIMGMPFKGFDHTTYNRETKQFESVWIDSMSAKFAILRGGFEGDSLIMVGEDKMMGQSFGVKSVAKTISDDEVYWEMLRSDDGGATWVTDMKMTYKRVK